MTTDRPSSTLVWDVPVRVFHWLLVLCSAGAWLTAEREHWRLVHVTLGYTMAGLVAFRVLWGLVGTRYARFASFVRGPSAVLGYLKSLVGPHPEHHTGHNPAGAPAIVGLLVLIAITAASGFATYNELGGEWLEDLHEGAANAHRDEAQALRPGDGSLNSPGSTGHQVSQLMAEHIDQPQQ